MLMAKPCEAEGTGADGLAEGLIGEDEGRGETWNVELLIGGASAVTREIQPRMITKLTSRIG